MCSISSTRRFLLWIVILSSVAVTGSGAQSNGAGRWPVDKATHWYSSQPWLVGANFVPSTAINELEMWQADTFDIATIDRELGWAESLGMNTMRVFLHNLLWQEDSNSFLGRMDKFLRLADRHKIRVTFVLLDSVWDPYPKAGKQRDPKPHVHNSGWVQAPGADILKAPPRWDRELKPYVKGVLFVEDTALVLDECAIITRPGAESRRSETVTIAEYLKPYRKLFYIQATARVDGGDILQVGKRIYVGLTTRSDTNAIEQMQDFLEPYGYELQAVRVTGCLHLKSAVTQVTEDTLLINPAWVDKNDFRGVKFIETEPSEVYAANAVMIDSSIIYPAAFPGTQKRLEAAGIPMVIVEADELAKAEGAVTCCSLIFKI